MELPAVFILSGSNWDLDSGMACVSELKRIGMPVPDASAEVSSITMVSVHPAAKDRRYINRICPKFCFIKIKGNGPACGVDAGPLMIDYSISTLFSTFVHSFTSGSILISSAVIDMLYV